MVGNSIEMSAQQPTYEESLVKIANLEQKLSELSVKIASNTAAEDDDDKKMEASFLKAKAEMDNEDKEKSAETDDMNKVKDAFKKAEDETDPDKKKEAMKKATDMNDDYKSKKAKKGNDDETPEEERKEHEAKIANTIMKKIPIMQKILEATKIIDPTNYGKVEKELTAATLEEVEAKYAAIQPYIAATGLGSAKPTPQGMPGMIPFQASTVVPDNSTDIFEASVDNIDFSKVKTSDIMGLYQ